MRFWTLASKFTTLPKRWTHFTHSSFGRGAISDVSFFLFLFWHIILSFQTIARWSFEGISSLTTPNHPAFSRLRHSSFSRINLPLPVTPYPTSYPSKSLTRMDSPQIQFKSLATHRSTVSRGRNHRIRVIKCESMEWSWWCWATGWCSTFQPESHKHRSANKNTCINITQPITINSHSSLQLFIRFSDKTIWKSTCIKEYGEWER